MDSLAVGKEPSVSCIVVALERQIALVVSGLVVSALNQDILECELLVICKVNVGTVAVAAQMLVSVIQSGGLVINEIAVGHRIGGGHVHLGRRDRIAVLIQGIGLRGGSVQVMMLVRIAFPVLSGISVMINGILDVGGTCKRIVR